MSKVLCIYHGGCDDGFGAAWVVRRALGEENVEFYPGVYQKDPPDCTGRDVLMVDFSYKRPVIEKMAAQANSVLILDHHKTAQEDLTGFLKPPVHWQSFIGAVHQPASHPVFVLFDMERSGAGIAWDFFFPDQARPAFVNYLEDRDLWRKKLPNGDEFTIALRSYPQEFRVWSDLMADGVESLIGEGHSLQRYYRLRVEELKRSAYFAKLGDVLCRIANAPYFAASEVAGELAEHPDLPHPFGACYFESSPGQFSYSLRSRGDFDVSEIAKQFGGGGHRNAAGFRSPRPVHSYVHSAGDLVT